MTTELRVRTNRRGPHKTQRRLEIDELRKSQVLRRNGGLPVGLQGYRHERAERARIVLGIMFGGFLFARSTDARPRGDHRRSSRESQPRTGRLTVTYREKAARPACRGDGEQMETRILGRTGRPVSVIGLGTGSWARTGARLILQTPGPCWRHQFAAVVTEHDAKYGGNSPDCRTTGRRADRGPRPP